MFISNKEKKDINEKFDSHKFQIDNLVKHVAEIQVDIGKTDIVHLDDVRESNNTLRKMYWGSDKKVKALEKTVKTLENTVDDLEDAINTVQALARAVNILEGVVNSLKVSNEVLYRQNESRLELTLELKKRLDKLETKKGGRPVGARNKVVIPAEKVQALKESGDWDDPIKRINSINQFIKDEAEKKIQDRKEKQRGYNLAFRQRQKAKKAAQKETA